jgi:hypothetical protein
MDIARVVRKYERHLRRLPFVIGIDAGEKNGREAIKVIVIQKVPKSELLPDEVVPEELDGFETEVVEKVPLAV